MKIYNYFKIWLKNLDQKLQKRNYFLEDLKQNELMSRKHQKVCTTLNYIEHFILPSAITGCISISAFAPLFGVPIGITCSTIGLQICSIAPEIKKMYNSIMKKKEKEA